MEEKKMTVQEIYGFVKGNSLLQVVSAYNGKVLCKAYNPEKHTHISERIVYDISPAFKLQGGLWAMAYLVVSVNGKEEYEEEQRKKAVE